jgi:hypothetical protein
VSDVLAASDAGPAPERQVALDMVRRALPFAPVIVVLAALPWGLAGAASAGFAVVLVVVNFLLAAWMLGAAARISYALVMAAALFGYLIRLGLIFLAVFAVKDASWVEPLPLGLTLIVTHLGLLLWELRYVSASLAYPGLKPVTKETATR